jgi:DNA-binding SARP family transcriptional activator
MEFLILGPLEASDDGRKLPLGGAKQRALLALLLLHANEVVPSDRLIDELWAGARPPNAAKSLTVAVSRLRKTLESRHSASEQNSLLVTRAPGYELRLAPGQLDLNRFERLLAEARTATDPATAAETLQTALALWRGPPLADLAYESFAQAHIARLEELRLAALEERLRADLELGRHADLVGELESLVAEYPLRERFHGQLMLALYRSGRQAEALEAYRAARLRLTEELGIEPSRELRELQEAILRQETALDLRAAAAAADAHSSGVFVGREAQLAELVSGLDDAFGGRGRLILLAGEPGIGKSRLAEELAAHARARGGRVLIGRCWEAGGAPSYWPWTQALRAYTREAAPEALRAQLGTGAPDLAQIVPELRERFPDLPPSADLSPPSPFEPEGARFRLFEAVAEFLRRAGEQRPLVLVFDDLHAADEPSLLLFRFLARELGATRMLVLGAYRQVDPLPGEPLVEMIAEVGREPVTRCLSLGGLSEPEVGEYLELTASEIASAELMAALHGQTEGNPLFVGEIVRLLSLEAAESESPVGPRLAIPQSVRHVIARRLSHLSQDSNRLLVLASVLGREFPFDVLARLGDVSEEQLLELLDEAIAARVISDVPGSPGRLRFEHVLIRDTLYEGLTSARRLRLHERVVAALEQLDGERPGTLLAELAQHSIAAGAYDKGLRYARKGADRALELRAYDEAARLIQLGLEALSRRSPVDPATRFELLLAAGDALAKAGSMGDAKEAFLAACDLARSARLPESFARAALGYGGGTGWQRAGGDTRLVPLLEEALTTLGEDGSLLRARLLARLAGALRDEPSLEPRSSMSREAVEIARRLGDEDTLAYALTSRFMATWGPAVEGLVEITDEVSRLAEETGSADAALDALTLKGVVAWLTLAADAETMDREYYALAARLGQAAPKWQGAMQNALWALFRGDFAAGERLEEQALRSGNARSADADCSYRLAMFVMRRAQGRLAEIEELIRDAVDAYPGYRSFRCFIPVLEYELGREDEARRAFNGLAGEDFAALPRDAEWLFCLALLAEVASYLHDRERASVLYRQLEPYPRVNAMAAGEVALGPVARYLGILAATTSRWSDAAGHFETAIAMNARMGARPALAHSQHDYARMLLARGEPGDKERARELLAECASAYRELGMKPWAEAASGLT